MTDKLTISVKGFIERTKTAKFWLTLLRDIGLLTLIVFGISLYQQQNMVQGVAPSLQGTTTLGHPLTETAHSNSVRVIYFWGTWCPYCKVTSPMVNSLTQDYQVITIARDSGNNSDINRYLAENDLAFDVLQDKQPSYSGLEAQKPLSEQWGVTTYPSLFVIDKSNNIRFTSTGITTNWGLRVRLWLASF